MPNSNLEQLYETARLLRPILPDLVFVGGSVTSILVTEEGAGAPRVTLDVDAIAEISSYAEYAEFGQRLRALGFSEDASEGAPLCRWVNSGRILDVMPLGEHTSRARYDAQIFTDDAGQLGRALSGENVKETALSEAQIRKYRSEYAIT